MLHAVLIWIIKPIDLLAHRKIIGIQAAEQRPRKQVPVSINVGPHGYVQRLLENWRICK
jgi:hypothetical protein